MKSWLKLVICSCFAFLLTSCGGKFSCKETIDGIRCETISSVYEREVMGQVYEVESKDVKDKKKKKTTKEDKKKDVKKNEQDVRSSRPEDEIVRKLYMDETLPIRVTPKIIRIWLAPWEDSDGDLHQPGYIYSEITDKRGRWLFGEKGVDLRTPTLSPVMEGENQEQKEEKEGK